MERVLQHVRRGLADPHALLRVLLLQHAVQRAPARAAAVQQLGRVSRWAGGGGAYEAGAGQSTRTAGPVGEPGGGASEAGGSRGRGGGEGSSGPRSRSQRRPPAPLQCMAPGTSGPPGACAPAPAAAASGTARAPAGRLSSEATPARGPRSKPSFATSPCALVGEREGAGWGQTTSGEGPSGSRQHLEPQAHLLRGRDLRLRWRGVGDPGAFSSMYLRYRGAFTPHLRRRRAGCGPSGVDTWYQAPCGGHVRGGCSHRGPDGARGPGCSHGSRPFLPRAGQWTETGTSGRAGAPAPPAAPRAGSSAPGSATGPRTGGAECQGPWAETRDCFLQQCPGQAAPRLPRGRGG